MFGYRRRRSKRNRNELGVVVALCFIIYLVSQIFIFLLNNIWLLVIPSVLLAVVGVICGVIRLVHKRYDKFVQRNSKPISGLIALNNEFKFNSVQPMHFEHSYDNANFYDSVSEEDYLVEKLTHLNHRSIWENVRKAEENKRLYSTYIDRVNKLRQFTLSKNVSVLFADYVARKEQESFESFIQNPCIEFYITVELFLTQINGRCIDNKEDKFTVDDITDMINSIQDKDGAFYRDPRVWDSICRVERAKVSNKMRFSIYQRDGNRCCKCGSPYDLEIDHIFPISKGGKTVYENLQTLCHRCNTKKSNTIENGAEHLRPDKESYICPTCKVKLVLKKGTYGQFYGCPNYPRCKYTKNI